MGGAPQYMDLAGAERHQYMLTSIFEHVLYKFEVAIGVRAPGSGASSAATGGSGSVGNASVHNGSDKYEKNEKVDKNAGAITNTDGVSAVAMLSVLSEFEASYREAIIAQYVTSSAGGAVLPNSGRSGMKWNDL